MGTYGSLAAPDGQHGAVTLHQYARLFIATLEPDERAVHEVERGRGIWLQVARGLVALNGTEMREGDAAAVEDEPTVVVEAETEAEVLLFDLGLISRDRPRIATVGGEEGYSKRIALFLLSSMAGEVQMSQRYRSRRRVDPLRHDQPPGQEAACSNHLARLPTEAASNGRAERHDSQCLTIHARRRGIDVEKRRTHHEHSRVPGKKPSLELWFERPAGQGGDHAAGSGRYRSRVRISDDRTQ